MWKILLTILVFIVLITLIQSYVATHPKKYYSSSTPADFNLPYEDIQLQTSDGLTLSAWFIDANKTSTVIVGHGYPFDKGAMLASTAFLYPHHNILYLDLRSFGQSEGKRTTFGHKEKADVDAAIAFIKNKNQSIGLFGFSLSASSFLLAEPQVSAIVADSPYASMKMMIHRMYSIFGPLRYPFVWTSQLIGLLFYQIPTLDVAKAASGISSPILLIHGDADTQIPVEHSIKIAEQSNAELWIIKGADHGMTIATSHYDTEVLAFFDKHLS